MRAYRVTNALNQHLIISSAWGYYNDSWRLGMIFSRLTAYSHTPKPHPSWWRLKNDTDFNPWTINRVVGKINLQAVNSAENILLLSMGAHEQ